MKQKLIVIVCVLLLALMLVSTVLAMGGTTTRRAAGIRVEWQGVEQVTVTKEDAELSPLDLGERVHLWRCERRYTPSCPPASEDPEHAHPAAMTP